MTSLVSDDFRERWRITECIGHISLTQHEMMPRYDRRTIYNLRQAFQRWQSTQNSVEATLQYIPLEERIDPQSRIVLSVFPDEQSPLFKLLGQLHHILFENTTSSCLEYHLSVTQPGDINWFYADVSAASPPEPVVWSLEPQSPHESEMSAATRIDTIRERHTLWELSEPSSLELLSFDGSGVSSATRIDARGGCHDLLELSDPPTSNRSKASSAGRLDPDSQRLESVARTTDVFCWASWRIHVPADEPG